MKNVKHLLLCIGLLAGVTACDSIEVDDGKYAEDVVGTYISNNIDTNLSGYDDETATIIITEKNDALVDIEIRFETESIDSLPLAGVVLSDGSGDDIDLDKEYSNAVVLGYVNGDSIRLKIDYESENYIDFRGSK